MTERYAYVTHDLLRCRVRDVASGAEGELMAVINENVSDSVREHWMRLAYIRGPSGREFVTAVGNVVPAVEARDGHREKSSRGARRGS
ncbi:hypothetical protein ACIRP0_03315 [Streptomyces sp. NPDC101733]|uniref:hypothetical protein n=1 Tax=unclassified Streptomyces TaxID=2593676 RepID=UPI003801DDF8